MRFAFVILGLLVACGPKTQEPTPKPSGACAAGACGPALGMPAQQCSDGSVGGNTGRCIVLGDGTCGWEIRECPAPPQTGDCLKTGCSGTICAEPGNDVMTTCEYKAEYACYQTASCVRQADGNCGWTQTPELQACLANPPPAQ
jgi:eight-cysteine-cluster-containing protein